MHCERRMAEMFVMSDVDNFQKDSVMLDVLPSIVCSLSDLVRAFRRASNPLAAYIMPLPWRALPLVLYPISPPGRDTIELLEKPYGPTFRDVQHLSLKLQTLRLWCIPSACCVWAPRRESTTIGSILSALSLHRTPISPSLLELIPA